MFYIVIQIWRVEKQKKKENNTIIESFNQQTVGVLSTSKSCDAGVDIKGLSVGIILSGDSSKTRTTQRIKVVSFYATIWEM